VLSSDDGLTLRLGDAVEEALRGSDRFDVIDDEMPGALEITLPSYVHWRRVGSRLRLHYTAEFAWLAKAPVETVQVSCAAQVLTECADETVREAKAFSGAVDGRRKRGVQVWRIEDGGSISKFATHLDSAFEASSAFRRDNKKPGTLILSVSPEVSVNRTPEAPKVAYTVQFLGVSMQPLRRASGSCWDDQLSVCARQILKTAMHP
jgi:hypothetical protein